MAQCLAKLAVVEEATVVAVEVAKRLFGPRVRATAVEKRARSVMERTVGRGARHRRRPHNAKRTLRNFGGLGGSCQLEELRWSHSPHSQPRGGVWRDQSPSGRFAALPRVDGSAASVSDDMCERRRCQGCPSRAEACGAGRPPFSVRAANRRQSSNCDTSSFGHPRPSPRSELQACSGSSSKGRDRRTFSVKL